MKPAFNNRLLRLAATRYRAAGRFAYDFARGKLAGDPVFTGLLKHGLVPDNARILDIGCGQGLLASWLHAAHTLHAAGDWPGQWPVAPKPRSVYGIELMPRDVARARAALHDVRDKVMFTEGDMCTTDFDKADVVVILDVLHYVNMAAQDDVLRRVRDALAPRGTLLLRVGDANAGLPFKVSQWVDHVVIFVRSHRHVRLYCRPLSAWKSALSELGFEVTPMPMHQGTPFANVLLVAKLR